MRSGRFDRVIEIPPPDAAARLEIFKVHTNPMPLAKGVDLNDLSSKTEGYTGADLENICREAGMTAIRRNVDAKEIVEKDFDTALSLIKPSVTKKYDEMITKFAKGERNSMYG